MEPGGSALAKAGDSARREPGARVDALAHDVIGAAIEVHRHLGPGFLERVYEEALCVELRLRRLPFERQRVTRVEYEGVRVGEGRVDLLVAEQLVLELKAVRELAPAHQAVLLSSLKATDLQLGLLINFGAARLKDGIRRVVRS